MQFATRFKSQYFLAIVVTIFLSGCMSVPEIESEIDRYIARGDYEGASDYLSLMAHNIWTFEDMNRLSDKIQDAKRYGRRGPAPTSQPKVTTAVVAEAPSQADIAQREREQEQLRLAQQKQREEEQLRLAQQRQREQEQLQAAQRERERLERQRQLEAQRKAQLAQANAAKQAPTQQASKVVKPADTYMICRGESPNGPAGIAGCVGVYFRPGDTGCADQDFTACGKTYGDICEIVSKANGYDIPIFASGHGRWATSGECMEICKEGYQDRARFGGKCYGIVTL